MSYVIVNLFVGVVLEAFENNQEGDILSAHDLEAFTKLWAEYDPDATWYIAANKVKEFVSRLEPPLGFLGTDETDVENLMRDNCLAEIPILIATSSLSPPCWQSVSLK